MDANPYLEPEYFIQRQFNQGMKRLSGRFKQVWENQNGVCHHCGMPMDIRDDKKEIFFKVPKSESGKDDAWNMAYVHHHCQLLYTERRSKG
jgi:RNA-directed DNA polymerase